MADTKTKQSKIATIAAILESFYTKARYYYNGILAALVGAKKKLKTATEAIKLDSIGTNIDELTNGISAYINILDTISQIKKFSEADKNIFTSCKTDITKAIEEAKNSLNNVYFEASEKSIQPDEKSILAIIEKLYTNFLAQDTIIQAKINEVANNSGLKTLQTISSICGTDSTYMKDLNKLATDNDNIFIDISEQITKLKKIASNLLNIANNSEWDKITQELLDDLMTELIAVTTGGNSLSSDNIRKINSIKQGKERSDQIAANATKYDWHKLFDETAKTGTTLFNNEELDSSQLWNKYCDIEWEDNAGKIRALGPAFRDELFSLGFSANTNPFVYFLKNSDFLDIVNVSSFDQKIYNALHNSYVKHFISYDDLHGTGKLGKNNLIFNNNLYKLTAREIESLLELQIKTIQKLSSNTIKDTDVYKNYKGNISKIIADLFYTGGNPLTMTTANSTVLKSVPEIEALFENCFGELEKKVNFDIELIKNSITNEKIARTIMLYLIVRYCDNNAIRNNYIKKYSLEDTTINYNQLKYWGVVFDNLAIDDKNLEAALKAVAKVGNIEAK